MLRARWSLCSYDLYSKGVRLETTSTMLETSVMVIFLAAEVPHSQVEKFLKTCRRSDERRNWAWFERSHDALTVRRMVISICST